MNYQENLAVSNTITKKLKKFCTFCNYEKFCIFGIHENLQALKWCLQLRKRHVFLMTNYHIQIRNLTKNLSRTMY